jgi:hypothetical protein
MTKQTSSLEDLDASSVDCGTFVVTVSVTNKRTTMDNCKKGKLDGIIMFIISFENEKKRRMKQ